MKQDLSGLLRKLWGLGVKKAEFHADGRLARVVFARSRAPDPAETETKHQKIEPPHIVRARRALGVIHGTVKPEAMDEEN